MNLTEAQTGLKRGDILQDKDNFSGLVKEHKSKKKNEASSKGLLRHVAQRSP